MAIVGKTGNDMPVQVGRLIAERGKIDLVGHHDRTQNGLNIPDDSHQMRSILFGKIGHLGDMSRPDHPAKARIIAIMA